MRPGSRDRREPAGTVRLDCGIPAVPLDAPTAEEIALGEVVRYPDTCPGPPGQFERATGVRSELELAFAGLQQLCAPMLDRLEGLPVPQRDALRTAFGVSAGPAPDRFLVGLAVLNDTHQVHAASRLAIWLAGTYAVSAHPPSAGGGRSATASATATINSAV